LRGEISALSVFQLMEQYFTIEIMRSLSALACQSRNFAELH
jgi:hypothetical protein